MGLLFVKGFLTTLLAAEPCNATSEGSLFADKYSRLLCQRGTGIADCRAQAAVVVSSKRGGDAHRRAQSRKA
jgi:hypothetical protein